MTHMKLFVIHAKFYVVESRDGTDAVPVEIVGSLPLPDKFVLEPGETISRDSLHTWLAERFPNTAGQRAILAWHRLAYSLRDFIEGSPRTADALLSVTLRECWGACYSAPGHLDRSPWMLADTEEEARRECESTFGDDTDPA